MAPHDSSATTSMPRSGVVSPRERDMRSSVSFESPATNCREKAVMSLTKPLRPAFVSRKLGGPQPVLFGVLNSVAATGQSVAACSDQELKAMRCLFMLGLSFLVLP